MAEDAGRPLSDYDRPSVAVDAVILTVSDGLLQVVVMPGTTKEQRIPGGFVHDGETLDAALARVLKAKIGLTLPRVEQLHVFDAPGRDPRGWVMSVAHVAVVNEQALERASGISLLPIPAMTSQLDLKTLRLDFDHDDMVWLAVDRVRAAYLREPDPWGLLEEFTLADLRQLHLAIDRNTAERDTFRRTMEPLLVDTQRLSSGSVGRPSRLWRRPSPDERAKLVARAATPSSRSKLSAERKSSRPRSFEFERILSLMQEQGLGEKEAMELYQSLRSQRRTIRVDPVAYSRSVPPERGFDSSDFFDIADDRMEISPAYRQLFTVRVRWVSGEEVTHESLRERDANRIFDELLREFTSVNFAPTSDHPVWIEMTGEDTTRVRYEELPAPGMR
jgi:ADP-ribose pyrophosphatase YjhB (NUDIX family)